MDGGFAAIGKLLIITGILLLILGGLFLLSDRLPQFGLGRLPGDMRIQRGNFTFYLPLGSCILLSVIITILWRLVSYLRR